MQLEPTCIDCGQIFTRKLYATAKKRCDACTKAHRKQYDLEYQRRWLDSHREQFNTRMRNYQRIYNPLHREKIRAYNRMQYHKDPEKGKLSRRESAKRIRDTVIYHYGGDPPKCACCGELEYQFLTIDHINGGGSKQRKEIGGGEVFRWIKKNNYPEGYQILCMNCNMAKGMHGICPHETRKQNAQNHIPMPSSPAKECM